MAYYVIARDPKTHDEWVMPKTFDTILETAEYLEHCKNGDPRFRYRIEGKETGEIIAPTGAHIESVHEIGHHTKDFTVDELFPNYLLTSICVECGVFVYPAQLERHTAWHNKLLP
jgi:hypothetical protein